MTTRPAGLPKPAVPPKPAVLPKLAALAILALAAPTLMACSEGRGAEGTLNFSFTVQGSANLPEEIATDGSGCLAHGPDTSSSSVSFGEGDKGDAGMFSVEIMGIRGGSVDYLVDVSAIGLMDGGVQTSYEGKLANGQSETFEMDLANGATVQWEVGAAPGGCG